MTAPLETENPTPASDVDERPPRRRAATAMEYLVAATFILVVLILGVQHFGSITSKLFGKSADATANTIKDP